MIEPPSEETNEIVNTKEPINKKTHNSNHKVEVSRPKS